MSTKCRTVSGAKKWPKKSDHTYENLAYKKKDGENKLKIVIDNFDRILDEYKAPTQDTQAAEGEDLQHHRVEMHPEEEPVAAGASAGQGREEAPGEDEESGGDPAGSSPGRSPHPR
jgi:hypothetical protein